MQQLENIHFRGIIMAAMISALLATSVAGADIIDYFDSYQPSLWSVEEGAVSSGIYTLNGTNTFLRTTSAAAFTYYTIETRVKVDAAGTDRTYYIGFITRYDGGQNACYLIAGGNGTFELRTRKDNGAWNSGIASYTVTPGQWYTFKIYWSAVKVELFVDGVSQGSTNDSTRIPAVPMSAIMDIFSRNSQTAAISFDWIQVLQSGLSSPWPQLTVYDPGSNPAAIYAGRSVMFTPGTVPHQIDTFTDWVDVSQVPYGSSAMAEIEWVRDLFSIAIDIDPISGNAIKISWLYIEGKQYRILWCDNLDGGQGNWRAVEGLVIETSGDARYWIDDGSLTGTAPLDPATGQRYYKVLEIP